jgi:hypothetical protein
MGAKSRRNWKHFREARSKSFDIIFFKFGAIIANDSKTGQDPSSDPKIAITDANIHLKMRCLQTRDD